MGFGDEKEEKRLFKELPFYNDLLKNYILNVLITEP